MQLFAFIYFITRLVFTLCAHFSRYESAPHLRGNSNTLESERIGGAQSRHRYPHKLLSHCMCAFIRAVNTTIVMIVR